MTASPPAHRAGRWDGLALALLATALYVALAQQAFWGVDAHEFLQRLGRGDHAHRYHFLYLPIAGAFAQALATLNWTAFEAARLASAVGTGVGVLLCHAAARGLGLPRRQALAAAAFSGLAPAVLFFATVVEVHGVFYAFVGAGWLALAHLQHRPTPVRAAALGLTTGLAASTHATGHLFFGLAGLMWLACDRATGLRTPLPRLARLGLIVGAAHASVVFLLGLWLQAPEVDQPLGGQAWMLFDSFTDGGSLRRRLEIVWTEWLWAFAPASITPLLAVWRRDLRAVSFALLAALTVYLVVASAPLIRYGTIERGAYFVPFALPFGWLMATLLPRALPMALALLATAAISITAAVQHDHPGQPNAYAQGLLRAAADRTPSVFIGDVEEARALLRVDASVAWFNLAEMAHHLQAVLPPDPELGYRALCAYFDQQVADAHRQGRVWVLTESARAWMADPAFPLYARFSAEHLETAFDLEHIEGEAFTGFLIRPR